MTAAFRESQATARLIAPSVMDDGATPKSSPKRVGGVPLKQRLEAAKRLVFYIEQLGRAGSHDETSLWWSRMIMVLPGVRPTHRCVFSRIAARIHPDEGIAFPSHHLIEAETDIGEDTITAAITYGETQGLLLVKRRARKPNVYRLALPKTVVTEAKARLADLENEAADDPEIFRDHDDASQVVQPRKKRRMNPKISVDEPEIFREELINNNRTREGNGLKAVANSAISEKSRDRALAARDADGPEKGSDLHKRLGNVTRHIERIDRAVDNEIDRHQAERLLRELPSGKTVDAAYDALDEDDADSSRHNEVARLMSALGRLADMFDDDDWRALLQERGHDVEGSDDD